MRSLRALLVSILLLGAFAAVAQPLKTGAQGVPGAINPFGGMVLFTMVCTCSEGNMLLVVGPPRPGVFVYEPFVSTLYMNYRPYVSSWVLGDYISGAGVCMVYVGTGCASVPNMGLINKIGTS